MPVMTRIARLLPLLFALALPAHAGEMHRLLVKGVERTYYLHVPPQTKAGVPLVIFLHGATANGKNDVHRYGWHFQAERFGFIVAGPDAPTKRADEPESDDNIRAWNYGGPQAPSNITASDDVAFIAAMIEDIARVSAFDRSRVYVAGFSSGAGMAHRIGVELADRIAAISASAGRLPSNYARPVRGMPVLLSAGDKDPVTPVEGNGTFVIDTHRVLVDRWRTLDDCPVARRIQAPANLPTEVSGPCRDGSEVRYMLMLGLSHEWPTTPQIDLTEMSWDFFKRFKR